MSDQEVGRVDPALVNHAPAGHGPTGFDPARWWAISILAERDEGYQTRITNALMFCEASSESEAIGRGTATAVRDYPGFKLSIIALAAPRDSGRLPKGEDPKGLSAEQARAAAQPHRPNSTSLNQGADDGR